VSAQARQRYGLIVARHGELLTVAAERAAESIEVKASTDNTLDAEMLPARFPVCGTTDDTRG